MQVQLVKALEKRENNVTKEPEGDLSSSKILSQSENNGIPVVRSINTKMDGMLDDRQRTWTTGFPNESSIENPVLYK